MTGTECGGYHLSQPSSTVATLKRHRLENARSRNKPLPHKPDMKEEYRSPNLEIKTAVEYHQTIGECRYLADSTRPNISFSTMRLTTFTTIPTQTHLVQLKPLLRYLQGARATSVFYMSRLQTTSSTPLSPLSQTQTFPPPSTADRTPVQCT